MGGERVGPSESAEEAIAQYPQSDIYPASQHAAKVFRELAKTTGESTLAIFLTGELTKYRNDTDRELPFRQESNFFYISGCGNVPGQQILAWSEPINGDNDDLDVSVQLFIPELDELDVMWSGMPLDPAELSEMLDVTKCSYISELQAALDALPTSIIHVLPDYPLPKDCPSRFKAENKYLQLACQEARLTKTAAEIDLIQKANDITSRAHDGCMRACGGGDIKSEYEAEAVFAYYCARQGCKAMSYESIAACCEHAGTLHYIHNNGSFPSSGTDGLLLLDAGCEYNNYGADITRTFPISRSGRFTKEAKAIYELVEEMQTAAFQQIKPGCSWERLQLLMHKVAAAGLVELGILRSPSDQTRTASPGGRDDAKAGREDKALIERILASGVTTAFFPHGLGHSLGLDVHDSPLASRPNGASDDPLVKYLRFRRDLEVGNVITVEPGIYFNPFLLKPFEDCSYIDQGVLKRYMPVGGVRLEDDILITKHGFHNFTTAAKSVKDVEALTMSSAPAPCKAL